MSRRIEGWSREWKARVQVAREWRGATLAVAGLLLLGVGALALPGRNRPAPAAAETEHAEPAQARGDVADSARVEAADADTPAAPLAPVDESSFAVGLTGVDASWRVPKPARVKGIYLNAWAAASSRKLERLIDLADRTELNTFVIDVKDATGYISYPSSVPLARQIGADREPRFGNVRAMLAKLKEHGIYPIARIVVFRDPILAHARPDWAMRTSSGEIWEDRYGDVWVDPFHHRVWDYNIALAEEAVRLGFAEVQWDYVRFPDTPARLMSEVLYPAAEGRTKRSAIREFLQYSRERLAPLEAPVTADVFGLTTSVAGDMGIGQDWPLMLDATDVLLPMVYPSHYVRGSYGIAYPNGQPYETVKTALEHGIRRSADVANAASIRPWLQDFTLGEPKYGPEHVRAQIQAVYDAGLEEWVLWNASSDYTESALAPAHGDAPRFAIPHFTPPAVTRPADDGLLGQPILLPDTTDSRRP